MILALRPRVVAACLFAVVLVLTVLNVGVLFLYFTSESDYVGALVGIFDFDTEGTIPSFYSGFAIVISSGLLFAHAFISILNGDGLHRYWLVLGSIMFFLGIDEAVAIHELLSNALDRFLVAEGFLYFLWVVPYSIITAVVGLFYVRFLTRLPRDTRTLFLTAGFLFLAGALGLELLGAREADLHGMETVTYCVLYTVEEFLEMSGIVVFIYALMSHPVGAQGPLRFGVEH